MPIVTKIKELCHANDTTMAHLERELGLSKGAISKWSKSSPSADNLQKIADYFQVSVDYLLGREKGDSEEFLLARKLKDTEGLTKEDKDYLLNQIENTIDLYLKAKGLI